MLRLKAIYDGRQVVLLEPLDLPANTLLEVIVLDEDQREQAFLQNLQAKGLVEDIGSRVPLEPFDPISIQGPPLSETIIEDRR